jgi:hypothetical protein
MRRFIGFVLSCVLLIGCDDDSSSGSGTGGTGGKGAGTGGSSASGGKGGSTGGSGGSTGGSGGSTGGTGGSGNDCATADDCPAPGTECLEATCENQTCGTKPVAIGTALGVQTEGDCKRLECDGTGSTQDTPEDGDVPDDAKPCTTDACNAGTPTHTPVTVGTACNGANQCDAQGECVACLTPDDCGTATECAAPTCTNGVCGTGYTPDATPVAIQTAGDCKKVVCDGAGATRTENDDTDAENDQNPCTTDTCNAGAPVHTITPDATCGTSGICNAQGECVGCNDPSDCQGTNDFCKTKTCVSNICGFSFTNANTPLPAADQDAGDCATKVCSGSGAITSIAAGTDLPVDGNACTLDQCAGGTTPQNPPTAPGSACSSGGSVCNGSGACVECVNVSQCGTAAVCNTKACVDNQCQDGFAPINTPCGAGTCSAGVAQLPDKCNATGSCVDGGTQTCSPYVCGPAACTSDCDGDPDCAGGYSCDTGLSVCTNQPKCTTYCNTIATNCTGTNSQYFSTAACLQSCARLPKGTASDTVGNTIGCRTYHATNAAGGPVVHCPHAGPGGDGQCGTNCAGFCTIALAACPAVYANLTACMNDCATFPATPKYNSTITSGNTFACRMYHLTNATLSPTVHCSHINSASPPCQ